MTDPALTLDPVVTELRRRADLLPPRSVSPTLARDVLARADTGRSPRTRHMLIAATVVLGVLVAATVPGRNPLATVTQPSAAMEPTVAPGERVMYDRELQPQHGDVVLATVHHRGRTFDTLLRVVAVGGETVACPPAPGGLCDALVVNGTPAEESYLDGVRMAPFPAVSVAPGQYFLLGDNRGNAVDSRITGPISSEEISGVALHVLDATGARRSIPGAPERPESREGIADPPEPVQPAPAVEHSPLRG